MSNSAELEPRATTSVGVLGARRGSEGAAFRPSTPGARGFWGAGHRAACWLAMAITLSAMVTASVAWSLLVAGRWVALAATTVLTVFLILVVRGHFRVRMVPDTTSRVPLVAVAVAAGGGVSLMATATPLLDQPPMVDALWGRVQSTGRR